MNTTEPNISLYGEGAGEDFPVLKAFQQYIDAEQAKARRRLITISSFFAVVLIAVIVIFSLLVISANERSQSLNDRLIEFAMKEADRKADDAKASALQEATVKTMTDTLQRLQKQVEDQGRKANAAAREIVAPDKSIDSDYARRQQEDDNRMKRAIALLKAEKAKLAEEKEKLRQAELERYRRENYPEYYERRESKKRNSKVLTYEDLEPDDEADEIVEVKKPAAKSATKKVEKKEVDLDEDDGIEYFNSEEDNFNIPVEIKGKRAGWRVPLD